MADKMATGAFDFRARKPPAGHRDRAAAPMAELVYRGLSLRNLKPRLRLHRGADHLVICPRSARPASHTAVSLSRTIMWCRVYEYLHARPAYHWEDERAGTAARIAWTPERREFRVHSERGGRFVLIEQFFPGWKATIDGGRVPIERWGGAFQSIQVPAGEHQIRFQFNSPGLIVGALVSLLAAAALVTAVLRFPRMPPDSTDTCQG